MKPFYKNLKFIAVGILISFGISISTIVAQTSISALGVTLTEDFSGLTPAGTWTNGTVPISNWYALGGTGTAPTAFILNNGSTTTLNSLSSFGSTGAPDRALGYVPGGLTGASSYYGWRLKNNTASTINTLTLEWTLEQWRKVNTGAQSLVLKYQISGSPITTITPALLFDPVISAASPQFSSGTAVLDGNLVKVSLSNVIPVTLPPGSEILLCWINTRASANHLLAIDDVKVTAKLDQTINFASMGVKVFGNADFFLSATASSGLTPITYSSSNPNVATVSAGNKVTIVGPGFSNITAYQAGNTFYNPATQVQGLNVKPTAPVAKKATGISPSQFTANWAANNGLNDAAVTYVVEYDVDNTFVDYDFYEPTLKTQTIDQFLGSGLTPNTIYYYRVYSLAAGNYSGYSEASAITTGTDYVTVNSGSWDIGGNWDVGYINNIANSITIRHPITLTTANVTTNKLVIAAGGKLTTSKQIYVTNELIVEVNALGIAGQILNTGNIIIGSNARVTVRKTFASGEWAFMGFPFSINAADVHIANTETGLTWGNLNSGANYIVQQYDGAGRASAGTAEYAGAGLHWTNVSPQIFAAKKGYIVYNNSGNVIDFNTNGSNIGTFFSTSGASVPAGRYASTNEHRDWNLITTPLSSKFNLGSATATSYYAYNGINYLPALAGESLDVQPFSSFFLQAPATTISFSNTGRKVVAATRQEEKPVDDIKLVLSNGNSIYDDMTRIRLQEDASSAYEIGTDAVKMFGMNPKVSYIYSTINKGGVAINTLPTTVTEVELTTKFAAAGKYSITIADIEKVQNYAAVTLIDKENGKRTDLLAVGNYDYSVTNAGTINRFKVQLAPKITTGVSLSNDQRVRISSLQGVATVSGLTTSAQLRVIDTTGKVVFAGLVTNNEPIRLQNTGLYIFELATPEKTLTIKAFVR